MKVFCFLLIHSSPASLPIVTHTHTTIHQICQEWLQTSGSGCNALSLLYGRFLLSVKSLAIKTYLAAAQPLAGWGRRIPSILTAKTSSSPSVGPLVPPTK